MNPRPEPVDKPGMRRLVQSARGFTLAEVLLASAILSFATLAIVQAVSAGQSQTLDALKRARANALAEALLEEVLSKPYADPDEAGAIGPEGDEASRSDFDNVDDYHGYSEAAGELTDVNGSDYPEVYQRFARDVTTSYDTVNVAALGGSRDGLSITVTITDTTGRTWALSRFVPEPAGDE